ncbi:MAG: ribulose-phosphate 3-epimerase [Nitrososphaerales archaeon]
MSLKIAPSILAGDLGALRNEVEEVENGGADVIHLDVMDGHFAPNITFGPGTIKALRKYSKLPFDAHLMINDPLLYLDSFVDAGCDIISVHAEVCTEEAFGEIIKKLNENGVKAGIAVNPDTEIPDWIVHKLDSIYLLNVMSVRPGFSGQKFMPEVLPKLSKIGEIINEKGVETMIEADGGVDVSNVYDLVRRGARILVAGNAVCGQPDVGKAIRELKERALPAIKEV